MGVASFENGPIGLHTNGGIVRGGVSDETLLAGAFAVAVHPRATFTMELLMRHISELRDFEMTSVPSVRRSQVRLTMPAATGAATVPRITSS